MSIIVGGIWFGSVVYCLLGVWSARRFKHRPPSNGSGVNGPAASLLKSLSGLERDLERNLESFFLQDYPDFELLFAVNRADDPALEIVERLRHKYPERSVQVIEAVDSPYLNAKVYSMELMARQARGEVLVISDSDVCVTPVYLREVMEGFSGPEIGVVTCLYRGAPGRSIWSRLEALGMSTRFMPGVLTAWALEGHSNGGLQFALGPTMAVRRNCLEAIGGFAAMGDYLADDFVMGKWAAQHGYRVVLSHYVLDHLVLGETFSATFLHQLRWARSTRFSRPAGYVGELFTHSTAAAVLAALCMAWYSMPLAAALFAGTLALRWWVSWEVGCGVLRDAEVSRSWWLIPIGDLLGIVVWVGGYSGRGILWRGTAYRVGQDGKLNYGSTST